MKQRLEHFIGCRFVPPASGAYLDVFEPAEGAVYAVVADGEAKDVDAAVEAASRAFTAWSTTPAEERGRLLNTIADVIGKRAGGWFIEPTVIECLKPGCRTDQEEIFGPVVTLAPFDTEREALELANGTRYGLVASVWTRDLDRAHCIAQRIEAGIV